jgi:hypothetical protein
MTSGATQQRLIHRTAPHRTSWLELGLPKYGVGLYSGSPNRDWPAQASRGETAPGSAKPMTETPRAIVFGGDGYDNGVGPWAEVAIGLAD